MWRAKIPLAAPRQREVRQAHVRRLQPTLAHQGMVIGQQYSDFTHFITSLYKRLCPEQLLLPGIDLAPD